MFIFTNDGGRKNLNHLRGDVDYWHRPAGVIFEISKYQTENEKKDYNSLENKYKEILIGSLFLMVLEKTQNEKFFISKTKNDPPDFVFMFLRKDEKGRIWLSSREVEIVRNVNSIEELEKTVLSKDKNYPKDMTILCYIETPGMTDLKFLSTRVCSKLKNISDIFVLFHGGMIDNTKDNLDKKVSLVQISPEYIKYSDEIDFDEIYKDFITDGEKLIYTKDGKVYYGKRNEKEEYPKLIK
jgi:hypothetical protein